MHFKTKDETIKYILKKHLKAEGNVLMCERLFVANSILEWVFKSTNNSIVIKSYISDLEKYIEGHLQLPWADDVVIKKKDESI